VVTVRLDQSVIQEDRPIKKWDVIRADHFIVPDAGCPDGYTQCDNICVLLSSDFEHCGTCETACSLADTDRCVNKQCVCGNTGGPCPKGLDCLNGTCQCLAKSQCDGCCEGNNCVPIGNDQATTKCGKQGEICKICNDKTMCTEDLCLSGVCKYNPINGITCTEGSYCMEDKTCQNGKCQGKVKDCSELDDQCNTGECDESNGKCIKEPKTGDCDDGKYCTDADTCVNGQCVGTKAVTCSDACNDGTCDEAAKTCIKTPKPDNTSCLEGNQCLKTAVCISGVCNRTLEPDGKSCGTITMGTCCGGKCISSVYVCCGGKACSMGQNCWPGNVCKMMCD